MRQLFLLALLTSGKLQGYNSFTATERIKLTLFRDAEISDGKIRPEIPPFSLVF